MSHHPEPVEAPAAPAAPASVVPQVVSSSSIFAGPKGVLLTVHPATAIVVDGHILGTSSTVHFELSKPAGELKVGVGSDAVTFSYVNKSQQLEVKPQAERPMIVDGESLAAGHTRAFRIDQRPSRIDLFAVDGSKRVILIKLAD